MTDEPTDLPLDGCPPEFGCVSRRIYDIRIDVHSYTCDDAAIRAAAERGRPAADTKEN